MRSGRSMAMWSAAAWFFASAAWCSATSIPVGPRMPLGPRALVVEMDRNPEIATVIERRGYPDWAEQVEVDSELPLAAYEVRLYYLRLDKEIAFARAYLLGQPIIGLRKFERPLAPAMRERIQGYYFAHDPVHRAELAAERAELAAERAERGAAAVVDAADRTTRIAARAERWFDRRLRK